jgi:glutathione S-transferase
MTCFTVHTVPGSPFARSVMAMLEERQADWRLAPLAVGEQKQPQHLARQPFGKMPALEFDGRCLYETQAILRYLDEALPGPSFVPAGLDDRARMNQVIGICDAYLFPEAARTIVFQRVIRPAVVPDVPLDLDAVAAAMPRAHTIFAELSRLLGERVWFGGAAISLGDVMVAGQLELFSRAPEWAELTAGRENLVRWLARIEARPAFQATLWERLRERLGETEAA